MNILLATENTAFDASAERVALALARAHGARLRVLFPLVSNAEYESVAPELARRDDEAAAAKLRDLAAQASREGVTLDTVVRHGESLAGEILAEAAQRSADVIVFRRRGKRGWLSSLLVGEVAETIASRAACPVLLVPRDTGYWSRGVMAVLAGTDADARVAANAASASGGAPLILLRVVAGGAAQMDEAGRSLAVLAAAVPAGVRVSTRVVAGAPAEAVPNVAREAGADLLVMGRGGDAPERGKLGAAATHIIGVAQAPVWLVPA